MADQWTTLNPGKGKTGSLARLQDKLRHVEAALETGQNSLRQAEAVFEEDWLGKGATAARANFRTLAKQMGSEGDAVAGVKKAIGIYIAEMIEIKALAKVQIAHRKAALDRVSDSPEPGKGSPYYSTPDQEDADRAYGELRKLATRRQEADNAILEAVRAIIATTWNVAPEDFPTTRGWTDSAEYDYSMDHPLGFSSKDYTAKQLMDLFKAHPSEVFPFPVSGSSSTFKEGAVFTLSDTLIPIVPVVFEDGDVVVTTTDTSVKFTVISDTYFDGPGSTIEFSIVEVNGQFVLRKVAHAVHSNITVAPFAEVGAGGTWSTQAENLKNVVKKYGG